MKDKNYGFKTERFDDGINLQRDNMNIEFAPFSDYYLTRNQQPKNDGFELIKSESRAA